MAPLDAPVVVTGADTAAGAASARALDGDATVLVLCGTDAGALGALAATLTSRVGRGTVHGARNLRSGARGNG
jgi:NADP-dependent 3-hydroxy acid dehydrogenase YdfG